MKTPEFLGGRACGVHERCCQSAALRRPRQIEPVEFDGALADHAARRGLLPNLREAREFFISEGDKSDDITILQLGCLLSYAVSSAKVRVEILRGIVGGKGFGKRARGELRERRSIGNCGPTNGE